MKKTTLLYFCSIALLNFSTSKAQSSATYDITFESLWNVTNHNTLPTNAHFSNLVGATHKVKNSYFELGQTATTGIKNIAEIGSNSSFMTEVNNSANTKQWYNMPFSPNNAASGKATLIDVEFTEEYHLLSLVSMIAPSPDWFIAVNSLDLRNDTNTDWKDTFTVAVFVYDAGTDSGTNYSSANSITSPATPITMTTVFPFNGNRIGTLTLTQKEILNVASFTSQNMVSIYPNPSKGVINLTNTTAIKTVQLYNLLGQKVKQITNNKQANLNLQFDTLKKGIYLIKMSHENGTNTVNKLILE